MEDIRAAMTAVQAAFDEDNTLVIEVVSDDVRVFLKRGYGRQQIDTGNGFEANLLEAAEIARQDRKG